MIKADKIFTSKECRNHEFVVHFNCNIWYIFARKYNYFIDYDEIDFKKYSLINFDKIPKWAQEVIVFHKNAKEEFEIKFTYTENGFTKKGTEGIFVNCFKQDDIKHEQAKQQFIRDYSDKYPNLEILSVTYC